MSNVHGLHSNRDDESDDSDNKDNRYVGGVSARGGGRCVQYITMHDRSLIHGIRLFHVYKSVQQFV